MAPGTLMLDLQGEVLLQEEVAMVQHPAVGGVILFGRNYRNPEQVMKLVASLRQLRSDLIIAVDQEGGRVQRFREGLVELPSLGSLGDLWQQSPFEAEEAAYSLGWLMATEILALGLDISFAPVLDLNPGVSEIIGRRAVHHEPAVTVAVLSAYIRGMHAAGMAATGKHFPGHGSVALDSHWALPVDNRSMQEIEAYDLQPFVALMDQLQGIMPAHVVYREVAPDPAGFSAFWLQEVLRRRLGFGGLIFSDDLSMQGAASQGSFSERAYAALSAGCDMVLVCNQPDGAREVLEALSKLTWSPQAWRHAALRGKAHAVWGEHQQLPAYAQAVSWAQRLRGL